ncbi:hypothetical protein PsorP6_017625 [Peronosclerospora sorghi]|uniref:Uncharacterized protein n=1 Tax=Peronosclerospora sorghi TaxID=230839 RepID=A0ACC0WNJ9_9STRA|nr:hypothetical protein PsorP6_017625 [Peronosclerospora sorghi]
MKPLLLVVFVLASIAAVVKSSLDLDDNRVLYSEDLGANGARTVRYLRSSVILVPLEWKNAFVQARKQFFDTESKKHPFLKSPLELDSNQRERLNYFFRADTERSVVDRVKILNAMKMSGVESVRSFAADLEEQLVQKWRSEGKTLKQVFEDLELDKTQDEMDCYSNPAFSTWMVYAKSLHGESWSSEMVKVLEKKENSKNFDDIGAIEALLREILELSEEPEVLFRKWEFIERYKHHEASPSN